MDASDLELYRCMFRYVSSDVAQPQDQFKTTNAAFVFGRQDRLVAEAAAPLWHNGRVERVLITGGIGKDSGNLSAEAGDSEAGWLADQMVLLGVSREHIIVEPRASNGGENCRFGLDTLAAAIGQFGSLIVVAHATSLRRLGAMLYDELNHRNLSVTLQLVPSAYRFDPENATDRDEVVAEIKRLHEWPHKIGGDGRPFLSPQPPVPAQFLRFL